MIKQNNPEENASQGGALPDETPIQAEEQKIDFPDGLTPEEFLARAGRYLNALEDLTARAEKAAKAAEEAAAEAENIVIGALGTLQKGDILTVQMQHNMSNAALANAMMRTRNMAKKLGIEILLLPNGVEVAEVEG